VLDVHSIVGKKGNRHLAEVHGDSDDELDQQTAENGYPVSEAACTKKRKVPSTRRKKQHKCKYPNYGRTKFFRSLEVDESKKSNSNKGVRTTKQSTGIIEVCMIYFAFETMTVNDHIPKVVLHKIDQDPRIKWEL